MLKQRWETSNTLIIKVWKYFISLKLELLNHMPNFPFKFLVFEHFINIFALILCYLWKFGQRVVCLIIFSVCSWTWIKIILEEIFISIKWLLILLLLLKGKFWDLSSVHITMTECKLSKSHLVCNRTYCESWCLFMWVSFTSSCFIISG